MKGRAVALLALLVCLPSRGVSAQVATAPAPDQDVPDTTEQVPLLPPVFAHDLFLAQLASKFSVASVDANTRFPGPLGLTEDRLAEHLPGIGFRRNGAPSQAGEYHWFGGDGEALGWMSDRAAWNHEPLGFPYYGASDPVLLPPLGDSLFVLAAPLLSARPAEVVSWRDPTMPDSIQAVALHANGPDGFSHTGGRFRGPIGGGYEFDGQFYRDFSDGRLGAAASDGHSLDFELRRRMANWPSRLRFRQVRGERELAFRWDDTGLRAAHRYLLTDVELATARPDEHGEWLFGAGLRHEDQKLKNPLLTERSEWFGRTLSATASRLSPGTWTRNVMLRGAWRLDDDARSIPAQKRVELAGELLRSFATADVVVTGAVAAESDQDPVWRGAAAAAWRPWPGHRVTMAVGRSTEAPPLLRRFAPLGSGVSGDPELGAVTHESVSIGWNCAHPALQMMALLAAGRSSNLPVWQALGDESTPYGPVSVERRYAGASVVVAWQPVRRLSASGGVDHLFDNSYAGGGGPVYAPDDAWFAELRWHTGVPGSRIELFPLASVRGARGGSLFGDYTTYSAGLDLKVKQLLMFWRVDNLGDFDYRTGGSAWAYGRHYEYGFRWEFWN